MQLVNLVLRTREVVCRLSQMIVLSFLEQRCMQSASRFTFALGKFDAAMFRGESGLRQRKRKTWTFSIRLSTVRESGEIPRSQVSYILVYADSAAVFDIC